MYCSIHSESVLGLFTLSKLSSSIQNIPELSESSNPDVLNVVPEFLNVELLFTGFSVYDYFFRLSLLIKYTPIRVHEEPKNVRAPGSSSRPNM